MKLPFKNVHFLNVCIADDELPPPENRSGKWVKIGIEVKYWEAGMKEKAFTPEQIIGLLTEEKVLLSQGNTVWKVSRKLGIAEQTYYRWKKGYRGMLMESSLWNRV